MVDIVQLVPKAQATAAQNCAEFVAMTRNSLTVFGPSLEFDATVWDVTSATAARGMGKKRHRITFSTLHSAASNAPVAMAEPFQSVAKGLIRYLQGVRPTQNQHQRLAALRALEHALAEGGRSPDICNADAGTFNRAAQLVAEEFSGAGAYRMGSQLELIAETVTKFRLSTIPILGWRQPLKRPGDTVRVGKEFEKRRAEKLPSAAALDAIPKAFLLAQALPDRVLTSIIAILCATPDRINEVLTLPLDCEVRQDRGSKGEAYGLRWWPSKGAEPMIKWVVPSMSGVVTEALDRLRNDLQEAHRIAAWYESNPSKLYLPVGTEDLRTRKSLSMAELADVVGLSNGRSARSWCESNNVSVVAEGGRLFALFSDVERVVISMLPPGFPVLDQRNGLTYSNALLVIRKNAMNPRRGTYRCMIEVVTIQHVNDGLGSRVEHGMSSIFSRLNFTEPDGSAIQVTSHQFRHYLNTLAQAGGLSQLDIAKWSGRKDIRENAAYDHMSADELLAQVREAIGDDERMRGPLAELPRHAPVPREIFAQLQAPTAHTTDFGLCLHDFTMLPCQLFRDCINCSEHVCIKGDRAKSENVRRRLEEARVLHQQAEAAKADGYAGADRWSENHAATVARLEQLYAILSDPTIPAGTVIQLSTPSMPSPIRNAMDERDLLEVRKQSQPLATTAAIPPPEVGHG